MAHNMMAQCDYVAQHLYQNEDLKSSCAIEKRIVILCISLIKCIGK